MVFSVRILVCSGFALFLASSSAHAFAKNRRQASSGERRARPFVRLAQAESDANVAGIREQNGKRLFESELWLEAASEFAAVYTNRRDPAMLFNMALCYRRAGDIKHALGLYQRYLREAPDSPNQMAVESRIKQLQAELAVGEGGADSVDPMPLPSGPEQIQQTPEQPQFQQQEHSQQQPGRILSEPGDEPDTGAPVRAGKFFLLYLGLNFPIKTGPAQSSYVTAPRPGGLFGFYVGSHVSINGEFSLDVLNPSGAGTTDEALLGFSFSPLIHFGSARVEFAVGPRLGYFLHPGSDSSNTDFSDSGLLYGLNVGAFFLPFRGFQFGGLLSLSAHRTQNVCQNDICGEGTGHTPFVLAFSVAVLLPRLCIRREGECL